MNDAALLEAKGLKKAYRMSGQTLEVLRGIDLQVRPGERVTIIGRSGAGKSTLLHLLGGLDSPTAGEIHFDGKDLYQLSDRDRALIRSRDFGFVFQFYHLVPELTAWENVALPGWVARKDRAAVRRRAEDLLKRVGLEDRFLHRPAQLSGGEQQRVALARALVNRPRLVFCDEPTGNLDSQMGAQILDLLTALHREEKTALVIVTHEQELIQTAQRVLSLKDGQLWD